MIFLLDNPVVLDVENIQKDLIIKYLILKGQNVKNLDLGAFVEQDFWLSIHNEADPFLIFLQG